MFPKSLKERKRKWYVFIFSFIITKFPLLVLFIFLCEFESLSGVTHFQTKELASVIFESQIVRNKFSVFVYLGMALSHPHSWKIVLLGIALYVLQLLLLYFECHPTAFWPLLFLMSSQLDVMIPFSLVVCWSSWLSCMHIFHQIWEGFSLYFLNCFFSLAFLSFW